MSRERVERDRSGSVVDRIRTIDGQRQFQCSPCGAWVPWDDGGTDLDPTQPGFFDGAGRMCSGCFLAAEFQVALDDNAGDVAAAATSVGYEVTP